MSLLARSLYMLEIAPIIITRQQEKQASRTSLFRSIMPFRKETTNLALYLICCVVKLQVSQHLIE